MLVKILLFILLYDENLTFIIPPSHTEEITSSLNLLFSKGLKRRGFGFAELVQLDLVHELFYFLYLCGCIVVLYLKNRANQTVLFCSYAYWLGQT